MSDASWDEGNFGIRAKTHPIISVVVVVVVVIVVFIVDAVVGVLG